MNRISKSTRNKILDIVYQLACDRYPNARGHQGLMQKIALDDFGIRLTKNRLSYWNNAIIKDEKKYMIYALTYGI